jgi:ribosomal protein S3AE
MAKEVKRTAKQVVKKKRWFPIVSPKFMGEMPMGESFIEEPSTLVGKTIKVNLAQLTGDMKSQNSDVKFEITAVADNKMDTRIIGYSVSPAGIKRFVRRHMTRIDDSIVVMTKDNIKIRIKPFLLTRSKVSRTVEYAMRAALKEELIKLVRETPYETLFSMILKYQLQKEFKEKLSKVYPIRSLEIRMLKEEKHHSARETELPAKRVRKVKQDEEAEEVPEAQAEEAKE